MLAVELLYHGVALGKTCDVRWSERELVNQRRKTVHVVRQPKVRRRIR